MSQSSNWRCLSLVALACALSVQFVAAQDAFETVSAGPGTVTNGTPAQTPMAPLLPGATNGTIGPQGADTNVVSGVNTAVTLRAKALNAPRYPVEWFAIPVTALALFFFVRRKRASFWELGLVSSVIVGTTGLAWGLLLH